MNDQAPARIDAGKEIANLIEVGFLSKEEIRRMPIGTRIMLAPDLRKTFTGLAKAMAQDPMTPPHLKDNESACFHVVRLALSWNADFYQVAKHTYSPSPGQLAIDGAAAAGAMLGSGRVVEIRHEHFGDWDKILGMFEMVPSKYKDGNIKKDRETGEPIMVPKSTRKPEDEAGLGVITTVVMSDGREVSTPKIFLNQCFPRNSTQWGPAPQRQICHVGTRAIGQIACGELFLGIRIDDGIEIEEDRAAMRVINPDPVDVKAEGIKGTGETEPGTEGGVVDDVNTVAEYGDPNPINGKSTRKRVKLTFMGNEVYKTKFITDVRHMLLTVTEDGFDTVINDIDDALQTVEDPEQATRLTAEVEEMITAAEKRLSGEAPEQSEPMTETSPRLDLASE